MNERIVLITGAAGFVASHLRSWIAANRPEWVLNLADRVAPVADVGDWLTVDLSDPAAARELLARLRPDIVFHLAGVTRSHSWGTLLDSNVLTTVNVLEAMQEHVPACRVVIAGSAAEYGLVSEDAVPSREAAPLRPVSPYGVAKASQTMAALALQARGVHVNVARVFNLIGAGTSREFALGSIASQLADVALRGAEPVIRVGNLDSRRDFVDIADVCAAFCLIGERGSSGRVYNVCSGRAKTIGWCVNQLASAAGVEVQLEVDPARVRALDLPVSLGSHDRLTTELGWRPSVSLEDSLGAMMRTALEAVRARDSGRG